MRFAREMLVPGAIRPLGKKRLEKSVRDNCGTPSSARHQLPPRRLAGRQVPRVAAAWAAAHAEL
jgi:hypothetical protein